MKYLFTLLPLLFLFSNRGCDERVTTPVEETGTINKLGDTLVLTKDLPLTLKNEKLVLTFVDNDESRCPDGVNCFVAGKAKIELTVVQGLISETVNLEVRGLCKDRTGKCGNIAQTGGYQYKILSADPYPESTETRSEVKDKSIRLIVSKIK